MHISNDTDQVFVAKRDTKNFFAAEEISEPDVLFRVYDKHGECRGDFATKKDASAYVKTYGGAIKKFVEDTSYGGGV